MGTLDYYAPNESPRPASRRSKAIVCIGVFHLLCAAVFVLTVLQGPPMGESEITTWDYIAPASALLAIIICPLGYGLVWVFVDGTRTVEPDSPQQAIPVSEATAGEPNARPIDAAESKGR